MPKKKRRTTARQAPPPNASYLPIALHGYVVPFPEKDDPDAPQGPFGLLVGSPIVGWEVITADDGEFGTLHCIECVKAMDLSDVIKMRPIPEPPPGEDFYCDSCGGDEDDPAFDVDDGRDLDGEPIVYGRDFD